MLTINEHTRFRFLQHSCLRNLDVKFRQVFQSCAYGFRQIDINRKECVALLRDFGAQIFSGIQPAEQCFPTQVSRVTAIDPKPIFADGKKVGVSARLQATIFNSYTTSANANAASIVRIYGTNKMVATTSNDNKAFRNRSHVHSGRTTTVTTERIQFDNRSNYQSLELHVYSESCSTNCDCTENPAIVMSRFQYDLAPVYSGQQPRFECGQVMPGNTEANLARPLSTPVVAPLSRTMIG